MNVIKRYYYNNIIVYIEMHYKHQLCDDFIVILKWYLNCHGVPKLPI